MIQRLINLAAVAAFSALLAGNADAQVYRPQQVVLLSAVSVVPSPVLQARFDEDSISPSRSAAVRPPVPKEATVKQEVLVRSAEEHFQLGKRHYQRGDYEAARAEFDLAIEALLNAAQDGDMDRTLLETKAEELSDKIYKYDLDGLGAGRSEQAFEKAPMDDFRQLTFPVDPKLRPKVVQEVAAIRSQLPLHVNDSVLSFINYFSSERGRKTLIAGLRRQGKYRPMISRILAEEGVPQELIFLAQAESGFMARAVSHAAAVGMWQFIASRGKQYGLNQNAFVDDRMDPEQATRAAARHLRDLYNKFGDWPLAIAAYNCGDGCVERAVQRTGYADFWELRTRGAVPRETTNYVPVIMALTIMAKNPSSYGIEDVVPEPALTYDTLPLRSATSLQLVADLVDRPVSELRELNPALLGSIAPAGYVVKVPHGMGAALAAELDALPLERRTTLRAHRADPGDTLASVAREYGVSVSALAALNGEADPKPGAVLAIPAAPAKQVVAVKRGKRGERVQVARDGRGRGAKGQAIVRAEPRSGKAARGVKAAAAKPVRGNKVASAKKSGSYKVAALRRR